MKTETNPKGAGRPVGAVQTPHTLLKAELKATAQTLTKVRTFIEEQLALLKGQLKDASIDQRLMAIDTITSVTEKLTKVMDAAAKHLAPKQAGAIEENSPAHTASSPEELLAALMKE